jgi:hypothetical protein
MKSTLGAGLFAQIKTLIQQSYINYLNNSNNEFIIDFSQEYFPYKDSINTCEFHNIMKLKENIIIPDNLKIYDIDYSDLRPFYNFINWDQTLVTHINDDGFDKLHFFRFLNNELKKIYLIKLNNIFNTIFDINKNIILSTEDFYNKYMKDYFVITIHYRGCTTINSEIYKTEHVNYYKNIYKIFNKIDNIIKDKKNFKIYLSTDVKSILNEFKNKFNNNLLYNINNTYMAETPFSTEPHFGFDLTSENINNKEYMDNFHKNKPGLNGGIQLLIDALLLSKGNLFIPSLSNLSDMVLILNPYIEYSYL